MNCNPNKRRKSKNMIHHRVCYRSPWRNHLVKKASSTITFSCEDGPKVFEAVRIATETKTPQAVTMLGTGRNEQGVVVAKIHITWTFKEREQVRELREVSG